MCSVWLNQFVVSGEFIGHTALAETSQCFLWTRMNLAAEVFPSLGPTSVKTCDELLITHTKQDAGFSQCQKQW